MAAIRGTITDAIPRACVRMDDGSQASYQDAIDCLEAGIPVTMALNYSSLRDDGQITPMLLPTTRLTKKQVLDLKHRAAELGVDFAIMQHSETNWGSFDDTNTWADMLAEVDPTNLENLLQLPVKHYLQPGDNDAQLYVRAHRAQIIAAIEAVGLDFAFGITDHPSGADRLDLTNAAPVGMTNSSTRLSDPTNVANGFQNIGGSRPGVILDPYLYPDNSTMDLGNSVVHRGVEDGSNPPLADTRSGAPGWMIGEDNNGDGIEGAAVGDWDRITQVKIFKYLSGNYSFFVTGHGTARTNSLEISTLSAGRGSAGDPQILPGHWSWKHLANFLKRLEAAGHVKMVDIHDFADYLHSDYALGTDLIDNPSFGIPQFDADERLDRMGDTIFPRGHSHRYAGLNAHSTSTVLGTLNAADADLRFNDPLAIETVIGRDIVGVHGLEGGAILQANDDGEYSKYEFGQDDMPPGRYKLSMIWGDYTTGKITLNDLHAFAVRLRWRSEDNLEDTVKHAQAEYAVADLSSGVFYQTAPSMDALGSMPQEFYFDLPADPTAVVTGSITEDPGSIADTTSFLLGSPTPTLVIANAKAQGIVPGAKARVRITKDMPAGAWATAEVVGLNSSGEALVEITLHNESGGAWVPGSLTAFVWIEVDYQADLGGYRSAPMGQWIWGVRASISKSTTTKVTMSKLEMIKVG